MIVFVHGVPETAAIWREVRAEISQPSTALELPGFGCPRPDGFAATKDAYADWLSSQIEAVQEPVDLVGHDWGAALTYRAASLGVENLRSWVADVGNVAHPDYVWHDFAKIWQTPGDGEAFFATQNAVPVDAKAAGYEAIGVPAHGAREIAAGEDPTMGECILDLYRSALPNVHADWGPWTATIAPGLVLNVMDDSFGDVHMASEVAEMLGASAADLPGSGHFWPYEAPREAAQILMNFWESLG